MRPSRLSRVARGGVAASVATWAAPLSRVAAGGAMPCWLGVAVPLALPLVGRTLAAFVVVDVVVDAVQRRRAGA